MYINVNCNANLYILHYVECSAAKKYAKLQLSAGKATNLNEWNLIPSNTIHVICQLRFSHYKLLQCCVPFSSTFGVQRAATLTRFLSYSSRATGRRLYTTDSSEFPPKWAEPVMRPEHVNNMPAPSFRETETDGGMTDRRPSEPESPATSHNVVSLVSRLADDHLTLVRVGVSRLSLRDDSPRKWSPRSRCYVLLPRSHIILLCSSRDFLTRGREGWAGGTSHQHRYLIDNVK